MLTLRYGPSWAAKISRCCCGTAATAVALVRLTAVPNEDAKRFRERARECRRIAAEASSGEWRDSLLTLAQNLEDEADRLDAEED